MNIDYSKIKALVIDDFAEFRRSVKAMVEQLGADEVDQAGSIREAVGLCESRRYHLILSDYNLGDGADGQQFLEELHHRALISPQTIFIMVTAENSTAMVMGALEYTPDGYLTKPFNKATLKSRLDKLVMRNQAMAPIHKAMSKQHFSDAINQCDILAKSSKRYAMSCRKLKAELLEDLHQFKEAGLIYGNIIESRSQAWALLGAGRCLYHRGEYEAAQNVFTDCIEQFPMYIGAYDWLAKIQEKMNDTQQAQDTLKKAVDLSPKAILRQQELGRISEVIDDNDTAQKAWRNAVKLGKHSVHKTPNNYVKLAKSLARSLEDGEALNKHYVEEEMQNVLDDLSKDFKDDDSTFLQSVLVHAIAKKNAEKNDEARKLFKKALELFDTIGKTVSPPPEATIELIIGLDSMGMEADRVSKLLSDFIERNSDNEPLMQQITNHFGQLDDIQQNEQSNALNVIGVKAFEQGDLEKAIEKFREAFQKSQKNTSIILNFAQALLTKARQTDKPDYLVMESLACLNNCKDIGQNHQQYNRYMELLKITNKLRVSSALKGE